MATIKAELEAAPSLKSFEYQPWNEETRNFVNSVIKMYLNPGDAMNEVTNTFEEPSSPTTQTTTTATKTKTETKTETKKEAAGGDDLESFLNELDI